MERETVTRGTTTPTLEDTWREEAARIVAYPEDVGWTRQEVQGLARRLAAERTASHRRGVRTRRPTLGPRPTTALGPPKPAEAPKSTERPRAPRATRRAEPDAEPEAPPVEVWKV